MDDDDEEDQWAIKADGGERKRTDTHDKKKKERGEVGWRERTIWKEEEKMKEKTKGANLSNEKRRWKVEKSGGKRENEARVGGGEKLRYAKDGGTK